MANITRYLEQSICSNSKYVIALSGGLDSVVLLHALVNSDLIPNRHLIAVHVDHQLQPQSNDWLVFCQNLCSTLEVKFIGQSIRLPEDTLQQSGIEAAARQARFKVLKKIASEHHSIIMTAHHLNDHAETVLLNLARGSGVNGLAGMLKPCEYIRPLIRTPRSELEDYAQLHQLEYVTDPSNSQRTFNRNFIRHDILPKFEERWPGALRNIERCSSHMLESIYLQDSLATIQLENFRYCKRFIESTSESTLNWIEFKNTLRFWLKNHQEVCFIQLSDRHYEWIKDYFFNLLPLQSNIQGSLKLSNGYEIRLYQHRIYIKPQKLFTNSNPSDTLNKLEKHKLKRLFQKYKIPEWERKHCPIARNQVDLRILLPISDHKGRWYHTNQINTDQQKTEHINWLVKFGYIH